jgi:hypothetical protein
VLGHYTTGAWLLIGGDAGADETLSVAVVAHQIGAISSYSLGY